MDAAAKPSQLADYPVATALPVQWGDQDAFGHVNNTAPIRWFESARIAYLEQSGLRHMMSGVGPGPILASIRCQYRRQLNYPDTVLIGVRVSSLRHSSITMEHAIYSQSLGEIAAEGESVIVIFDYESNRPRRVPADVRAAFEKLEGRTLMR